MIGSAWPGDRFWRKSVETGLQDVARPTPFYPYYERTLYGPGRAADLLSWISWLYGLRTHLDDIFNIGYMWVESWPDDDRLHEMDLLAILSLEKSTSGIRLKHSSIIHRYALALASELRSSFTKIPALSVSGWRGLYDDPESIDYYYNYAEVLGALAAAPFLGEENLHGACPQGGFDTIAEHFFNTLNLKVKTYPADFKDPLGPTKRNRQMLADSQCFVALWNGDMKSSGTLNFIKGAHEDPDWIVWSVPSPHDQIFGRVYGLRLGWFYAQCLHHDKAALEAP